MRNDTVDEREELPGCVQAGKVWKCVFPRSCAVCFEKICPSLQPGCKAGLWGEGIQLPSSQDCCCSAGCQWESLSKPTHPNWGHVWLLGRRWRAQEQSDSARPWVTPRAHFSELLILMYCFTGTSGNNRQPPGLLLSPCKTQGKQVSPTLLQQALIVERHWDCLANSRAGIGGRADLQQLICVPATAGAWGELLQCHCLGGEELAWLGARWVIHRLECSLPGLIICGNTQGLS